MPRNTGTNIYTIPPDTEGIPDQTIESATYNIYLHDVEKDLNDPRPIIAGGTGANDADEALANLGAEKAAQVVTNYDTHVWIPGSFRSAGSATAGPVDGHAFAGIVYINENYLTPPTNANVVVSARDMNDTVVPGQVYVREKKANVWGPWALVGASTTPFPPGGGLSATTILAAIQELDAEKASIVYVDGKFAPIASPLFTGDARAPTPTVNDNDTTIATTAFVSSAVSVITGGTNNMAAFAASNMVVNGSMDVNQEFSVDVGTSTDMKYGIDGWLLQRGATSAGVKLCQVSSSPTGFTNSQYRLACTVLTPDPGLGPNNYVVVTQHVEGYRAARKLQWGTTQAQPMTIGFWSGNSPAGIYSIAINNELTSHSYVTSYTQAVASSPQYNVVVIPGTTGSGLWEQIGPGIYFRLSFAMACGANRLTPAPNTWALGNYYAVPGQVNATASATVAGGPYLAIGDVAVLPGSFSLPAAQSTFLMRPYDQEIILCKRYLQKHTVVVDTPAAYQSWAFPVEFRNNPAVTGGGTGFAINSPNKTTATFSQTSRAVQTLLLDART